MSTELVNGSNVLITGGSSGIGLCLAHLFHKSGANVTILARDQNKLDKARHEIIQQSSAAEHRDVCTISMDLNSDYDLMKAKLDQHIANHGRFV